MTRGRRNPASTTVAVCFAAACLLSVASAGFSADGYRLAYVPGTEEKRDVLSKGNFSVPGPNCKTDVLTYTTYNVLEAGGSRHTEADLRFDGLWPCSRNESNRLVMREPNLASVNDLALLGVMRDKGVISNISEEVVAGVYGTGTSFCDPGTWNVRTTLRQPFVISFIEAKNETILMQGNYFCAIRGDITVYSKVEKRTAPPSTTRAATPPPTAQAATLPPTTRAATLAPTTRAGTSRPTTQAATPPPTTQAATPPPTTHAAYVPPPVTSSTATEPPSTRATTPPSTATFATVPSTATYATESTTTTGVTSTSTTTAATETSTWTSTAGAVNNSDSYTTGATTTTSKGTYEYVPVEPVAGGESACFPSDARVALGNGDVVSIDKLQVGDLVRDGMNSYSPVTMFTHADAAASGQVFVLIQAGEDIRLHLSPSHYIYANGKLVIASMVKTGDMVRAGRVLEPVGVTAVSTVRKDGLYNPQTVSGDIVVNDVLVSTFTAAIPIPLARALLGPVNAMQRTFGLTVPRLTELFVSGAPWLASALPDGRVELEL
jgi:hypothetical protein